MESWWLFVYTIIGRCARIANPRYRLFYISARSGRPYMLDNMPPPSTGRPYILHNMPLASTGRPYILHNMPPCRTARPYILDNMPSPSTGRPYILHNMPPPSTVGFYSTNQLLLTWYKKHYLRCFSFSVRKKCV